MIERERLLEPLQQVSNLLKGRPKLPILGHLLLQVTKKYLLLTATDLDMEMGARIALRSVYHCGTTTVPARKLLNICRGLPEGAEITLTLEDHQILVSSYRSSYLLATLPASDFPYLEHWDNKIAFTLLQVKLKQLIESTQFAMAYQDVRYYLNGMLWETKDHELRTVATDGHRLAIGTISIDEVLATHAVIVPRQGVLELVRILNSKTNLVTIQIGENNIRATIDDYIFTSKLVNGRFPDYRQVLPQHSDKTLQVSGAILKQAVTRAAILAHEKFRGIRLFCCANQLTITANNQEQEAAQEIIDVTYQGSELEISFNASYLLDVLNVLKGAEVKLLLTDSVSGVQIEDYASTTASYVIMPMRL